MVMKRDQVLDYMEELAQRVTSSQTAEHFGWAHEATSSIMRTLVALKLIKADLELVGPRRINFYSLLPTTTAEPLSPLIVDEDSRPFTHTLLAPGEYTIEPPKGPRWIFEVEP